MARKPTYTTPQEITVETASGRVAVVPSAGQIARMARPDIRVYRDRGTTLVVDQPYMTRDRVIQADEIYFVEGAKPKGEGPWLAEADKVAWRDEASGYECIMMRATEGGYLDGYVGVPPSHPLHGFDAKAVPPDIGIEVHGGLTYARICQDGPSPERRIEVEAHRICHVARVARHEPTVHATGYRVEEPHAWWFGFECNHAYDVVPGRNARTGRFLAHEVGGEYRDDGYVCNEILNLAAQLRAIEDGVSIPGRQGPPLPPIGLDPDRAS
ncbi:hypothetical protein EQZ23_06895 [Sphingomonas sp. UV9]|uniref:hypothetical protein n=1 Tax=Sphingomonas sp. UV9 TaxID=1851410 RepID=UPI000FFB16B5|nr:hypothetical protein [Sphingomonas sp. UV9]RXD04863.1 hypothetical protein EQZ23_06895 [Sphingomonas sp. UV9]